MEEEFMNGYIDGRNLGCPQPNDNRHPAYTHSFKVGRAELQNNPIPAYTSRKRAKLIEENLK